MGLAFWCLALTLGFTSDILEGTPSTNIFQYEALTILSALYWAAALSTLSHFLAIFTDSLNTIQMFNTFHVLFFAYNLILFLAIHILLHSPDIDLHVFHILDDCNYIANAISHHLFDIAI